MKFFPCLFITFFNCLKAAKKTKKNEKIELKNLSGTCLVNRTVIHSENFLSIENLSLLYSIMPDELRTGALDALKQDILKHIDNGDKSKTEVLNILEKSGVFSDKEICFLLTRDEDASDNKFKYEKQKQKNKSGLKNINSNSTVESQFKKEQEKPNKNNENKELVDQKIHEQTLNENSMNGIKKYTLKNNLTRKNSFSGPNHKIEKKNSNEVISDDYKINDVFEDRIKDTSATDKRITKNGHYNVPGVNANLAEETSVAEVKTKNSESGESKFETKQVSTDESKRISNGKLKLLKKINSSLSYPYENPTKNFWQQFHKKQKEKGE